MPIALLALAASVLLAQSQTYTYDSDGRRVPLPATQETRKLQVVEDGPNGRIVEEIVQRRDASGNPLPAEKVRTVTRQSADGAQIVESTTFRADINGRMETLERTSTSTTKEKAVTTVERPNINGRFDLIEKAASQTTTVDGKTVVNTSIYRTGLDGKLVEAVRQVTERKPEGNATKEILTEYQNASTGRMELSAQKVTVSMANPDGTTTSEITIYGLAQPGRPTDGQLHVREQQLLTTKPGPNNTVQETISVRRPDLADPHKLGAYTKIAEKVTQKP
jgi:hypothetical protein